MVRMPGIGSIGFSRPYDDAPRLTHPFAARANRGQTRGGVSVAGGQPALAESQPIGSTRDPLTLTSKCRCAPYELPVLPTLPMNCPAETAGLVTVRLFGEHRYAADDIVYATPDPAKIHRFDESGLTIAS